MKQKVILKSTTDTKVPERVHEMAETSSLKRRFATQKSLKFPAQINRTVVANHVKVCVIKRKNTQPVPILQKTIFHTKKINIAIAHPLISYFRKKTLEKNLLPRFLADEKQSLGLGGQGRANTTRPWPLKSGGREGGQKSNTVIEPKIFGKTKKISTSNQRICFKNHIVLFKLTVDCHSGRIPLFSSQLI